MVLDDTAESCNPVDRRRPNPTPQLPSTLQFVGQLEHEGRNAEVSIGDEVLVTDGIFTV